MKDTSKTKAQLIEELQAERRKAATAGSDADLVLQLAAERVRATAMDMRGTHDLHRVVAQVYQSLIRLGIDTPATSVYFVDESSDTVRHYNAGANPRLAGLDVSFHSTLDIVETRDVVTFGFVSSTTVDEWLQKESPGLDAKNAAQQVYRSQTRLTFESQWKAGALSKYVAGVDAARYEEQFWGSWSVTNVPFRFGMIGYREREHHPEHDDIVAELARGLEFGFLRFLDFQKVEQQNRELQVEAALGRIRNTALAMESSADLPSITATLYLESTALGVGISVVGIVDEVQDQVTQWTVLPESTSARWSESDYVAGDVHVQIELFALSALRSIDAHWRSAYRASGGEPVFMSRQYSLAEGIRIARQLTELSQWTDAYGEAVVASFQVLFGRLQSLVLGHIQFKQGYLLTITETPFSESQIDELKRIGDVFAFAYSRFLELKAREDQNRELTIQNALERVRARALGMQQSNDIGEVTGQLFREFNELGMPIRRSGIWLIDVAPGTSEIWMTEPTGAILKGTPFGTSVMNERPDSRCYLEAFRGGESRLCQEYSVAELVEGVPFWVERMGIPFEYAGQDPSTIADTLSAAYSSGGNYVYHLFMPQGSLQLIRAEVLSEHELQTAERFAAVFSFAYDRFLELKKLETQNRELQVEAALERVRSRAQGMHRSEELSQVAAVLFQEFKGLDIDVFRAGMWILNPEAGTGEVWLTGMEGELRTGAQFDLALMEEQPLLKAKLDSFRAGEASHVSLLQGQAMWDALRYALDRLNFPMYEWDTKSKMDLPERFYLLTPRFEHGVLHLPSLELLTEEEISTSCRFADVFGFAYSRMREIAKAEKEARQAERRAAADRVRAEIAIMRTSADLEHLTPLIWKELTQVGVSFFRCGVFIVDEEQQQVRAFLANPEGEPLAALNLPIDSPLNRVAFIDDVISHWREGRIYVDQWDQQTFAETMQALIAQGQPIDRKQYMGGSEPPESLALQMIPFAQGLLYVGSAEPLPAEDVDLVRELAAAFSVAYARFQDFQLLEAQNIQIQEANRLKSDFLARMSHDLRTPMNAIVGYTRILQRRLKGTIDDRQYSNLTNITTSADHLLSLINDILDLSKIEAGGIEIRPQQVDLQQLVTNCMTSVQPLVAADVRFEAQMEPTDAVYTDPDRLQRVVMNLLSNAAKFTAAGSITVSLTSVDGWIELAVADTGPGIPSADLPFIFDEFRQVEGEQKEGTGLGLSIAKKSIELLGGTIAATSQIGAGTTFTLRICDYVEPPA